MMDYKNIKILMWCLEIYCTDFVKEDLCLNRILLKCVKSAALITEHSATVEMCGRIAEALGISLADLFQDL